MYKDESPKKLRRYNKAIVKYNIKYNKKIIKAVVS